MRSSLLADGGDHARRPVADIEAADAAGEIDEAIAVDVFDESRLRRARRKPASCVDAARDGRYCGASSVPATWVRELRCVVESWPFQYHPIGCSLRLM